MSGDIQARPIVVKLLEGNACRSCTGWKLKMVPRRKKRCRNFMGNPHRACIFVLTAARMNRPRAEVRASR